MRSTSRLLSCGRSGPADTKATKTHDILPTLATATTAATTSIVRATTTIELRTDGAA